MKGATIFSSPRYFSVSNQFVETFLAFQFMLSTLYITRWFTRHKTALTTGLLRGYVTGDKNIHTLTRMELKATCADIRFRKWCTEYLLKVNLTIKGFLFQRSNNEVRFLDHP